MLCNVDAIQKDVRYTPDWASLDSRSLPGLYDEAEIGICIHWGASTAPSYEGESSWLWKYWNDGDKYILDFIKNNYPPEWTYADFARCSGRSCSIQTNEPTYSRQSGQSTSCWPVSMMRGSATGRRRFRGTGITSMSSRREIWSATLRRRSDAKRRSGSAYKIRCLNFSIRSYSRQGFWIQDPEVRRRKDDARAVRDRQCIQIGRPLVRRRVDGVWYVLEQHQLFGLALQRESRQGDGHQRPTGVEHDG